MSLVIVVPGVLGSELWHQVNRAWPPAMDHHGPHDREAHHLLEDGIEARNIVATVSDPLNIRLHADMYAGLMKAIDEVNLNNGYGYRTNVFYYDWRRGVRMGAEALARRIHTLAAPGEDIAIVAHSMGGLVARCMLETGIADRFPFRKTLCRVIFIATPHYGSPLAIRHALGHVKPKGMTRGAAAHLSMQPGMIAMYELMPNPALLNVGISQRDLNFLANRLTYPGNWAACYRPPPPDANTPRGVRYFNVVCTGHRTVRTVRVFHRQGQPQPYQFWQYGYDQKQGDGTVPFESQLADFTQGAPNVALVPAKHEGILSDPNCWAHLVGKFADWLRPPFCSTARSRRPPPTIPFAGPTPQDPISTADDPPTPAIHMFGFERTDAMDANRDVRFSWKVERAAMADDPAGPSLSWIRTGSGDRVVAPQSALDELGGQTYAEKAFDRPGAYRLTTTIHGDTPNADSTTEHILFVSAAAEGVGEPVDPKILQDPGTIEGIFIEDDEPLPD